MKPHTYLLIAAMTIQATALAERPQVLVSPDQHAELADKVESVDWAKSAYTTMKERVDRYVAKTERQPDWMSSRLAMNWDTRYVQTVTMGSRSIGGKGRAPVPTPRFAGARDWKTDYARQSFDELKPYNDKDGQIMLVNTTTGKQEWAHPSITGHAIERINTEIMQLVAEAAYVYWITGDEKYADFAAPVLWTYMEGLSHVRPPIIKDGEKGPHRIIGTTSYEVIHEKIVCDIAIAYDFMHAYIAEREDMDGAVIEAGIKTIIDRVIDGGGRTGNWNLHQAKEITYGALALEDNDAYADGKGREYYVDLVLHADLPQQWGLIPVIENGYDQETAIWPEAAGYAFDTTANIVEIASLLSAAPSGRKAMDNSTLQRAIVNQMKQLYPSGCSTGIGDTSYTRLEARAAELMLAYAVQGENTALVETLTAALKGEVASGKYARDKQTTMLALTSYLSELPEVNGAGLELMPTYYAKPIDIVMQRNMPSNGDPLYALGAAMFGTAGGHMHANGLAIELYGAGHVLGVDSGRGSSYWQPDHGKYYSKAPAHNTVIVNGRSSYARHGQGTIAMVVQKVEPAFGQPMGEGGLTYLTSSFEHVKPAAVQQRTLALVRVDDTTAFYFDVFRSKLKRRDSKEYHDWLYHGMAESLELHGIQLQPSHLLTSAKGNMDGYDYFTEEVSAVTTAPVHARFPLEIEGGKIAMEVWMPGGEERQIFSVNAPDNRGARHYVAEKYWQRPTPTLVVRQSGEAWERPFVAVYEPYLLTDGAKVRSVKALGDNRWEVRGDGWTRVLKLDGVALEITKK